jgi:hypothetical protein
VLDSAPGVKGRLKKDCGILAGSGNARGYGRRRLRDKAAILMDLVR